MASVYTPKECARKAKHIVLSRQNRKIVDEFITILGMKERFAAADVPLPNKLVMFGPPGTGKTLTAFHLARQLDLPLVLVRLDTVIHSHLGRRPAMCGRFLTMLPGCRACCFSMSLMCWGGCVTPGMR